MYVCLLNDDRLTNLSNYRCKFDPKQTNEEKHATYTNSMARSQVERLVDSLGADDNVEENKML